MSVRMVAFMMAVNITGAFGSDTLSPLTNDIPPATVEALWAGYDPRAEPLDVEVLKEWEEDGVVLRVLRYRVGVFKGKPAMLAAVYGYPKGGTNLPGLVQIHGGGQFAQYQAPLSNAKRGYATISIAWAGRLAAPNYQVDPDAVKLFWEGQTNHPRYRVTTDWGALDAYHSPCREPGNNFILNPPSTSTIDPVPSPRNSGWFPCAMAARRALTFLEQQPEVDPKRLGVYGHSMGGKLTVLTAGTDSRVKAAAPSCGGISDDGRQLGGFVEALGDKAYLKNITCPIAFMSPANDFHGQIKDLKSATEILRTQEWRAACAPHHNHQDNAESEVMTQLWMDQYLRGTFVFPKTPEADLRLASDDGVPSVIVRPDTSRTMLAMDVYYSQQVEPEAGVNEYEHAKVRFWHHALPVKAGDAWTAKLPLPSAEKPLWVYANVLYKLDEPVRGVGYYYRAYTAETFLVSSLLHEVSADALKSAGVKTVLRPSLRIEDFEGAWEKEWFTYRPEEWGRSTHKVYDQVWKAPVGARLAVDVRSESPNKLVISMDDYAAEIALVGGLDWQTVELQPGAFLDAVNEPRVDWSNVRELRLSARETLRKTVEGVQQSRNSGADWKGAAPSFRNLRWIAN